ncbi:MAG TPA: SUMF1/EgtB/PvdO family nonheme iron enzyme [Pyrinomonadaceae bacterium]
MSKLVLMTLITGFAAFFTGTTVVTASEASACPDDSVASGTACIDKYEASIWYVPPEEKALINKIQKGEVKLADLMDAGAVQLGIASGDLAANGCPVNGNGCANVYAVSIAGVTPAGFVTWFQAAAAARNSLKRLPTNQEWQVAALGTPDGAPCNVGPGGTVASTGSAPGCVSDVGAFDMVGNVWERVADWADFADGCVTQSATFGGDLSCVGGPGQASPVGNKPGAMLRGGFFGLFELGGGTHAGVFAVRANVTPDFAPNGIGFRCAR